MARVLEKASTRMGARSRNDCEVVYGGSVPLMSC